MRGMVTIGEMNRDRDTSETYAVTVTVDLWEKYRTPRMRCMAHMSMPFVLPNGQSPGILISGIQHETWHDDQNNLRIKEHRQAWQVVPVERQGSK
jgi:hypothetical protein